MKTKLLPVLVTLLCFAAGKLSAQAPQKINYQAVVRGANGQPVNSGTPVSLRFTIHDLIATGAVVFTEVDNDTTNQFGLVNTQIGGSTSLTSVNWGSGAKYLEVELDISHTGTYTTMGASELLSVPYALYAGNSSVGPQGATGANGSPGVTGATGPTGLAGATGAPGQAGNNGATGAQGVTGATGAQGIGGGATGATGATGPTGNSGAQGVAGATGATGAQGLTGAQGTGGVTGATGAQGQAGSNGPTGAQGIAGVTGPTGGNGATGNVGATGATGNNGSTGATGGNGATGATGADGAANAWGLTGNTGTVGGTNFIGTLDAQPLYFKTNNNTVGLLPVADTGNICFGIGSVTTAGTHNIVMGSYAFSSANTGTDNMAFGQNALGSNTTGHDNIAMCNGALVYNTSGNNNIALGQQSQFYNTTGEYNVAIGYNSLQRNTTGNFNTALAPGTLSSLTTGSNNTVVGYNAGHNTTGSSNVFLGYQAGISETGSSKLYIANTGTATPLLYGDFSQKHLTVNDSLTSKYFQMTNGAAKKYVLQSDAAGNGTWVNDSALTLSFAWGTNGNAGTNANANFIGTTDNADLVFKTASAETMRLTSGGYVGIGNTTPHSTLQVYGTASFGEGDNATSGFGSFAAGRYDTATGNFTQCLGVSNFATGYGSATIGGYNYSRGNYSFAAGYEDSANADQSFVTGRNNVVYGYNSAAFGTYNYAPSGGEFVVGNYCTNYTPNNNTGTSSSDRVFTVGNGTSTSSRSNAMVILKNGNVGIATSSPAYPLDVQSINTTSISGYGYLSTTGAGTNSSSVSANISIRASGRIICAEFDAISDARVKNILGRTNNAADLNTLMQLQITDYKFIDTIGKGNKSYKKIIAQELEKIYPDAVSKQTDVIPDIYQLAEIKDGRITLANTLKAGDKVKVITGEKTEIVEVTAADAQGFNVKFESSGKIFVYGRQVSDFRAVDYEALTTLNISATQALVKMVNTLQAENNQVKQENADIKNKLATVTTDIETIKQALQITVKAQK